MADGVKTYEIVINGLSQSISQVDALNKKLEQLEKRMNSLPKGSVGGAGGSSKSELKEEEKLLQEIDKLNSKILATRTEEYKVTQQQKQALKESKKEVEETLAKERILSNQYDNTIKGWKQELKDIKSVMQSMNPEDVGFDELTQRADELNTKLKNVEQSYGQFGRNVGNYQNDVEKALKNVTVTVGGVERQFNSTKDASRILKEELKAMSVNGQQDTKEFKELSKAVEDFEHKMQKANSAVNDLKKSSSFMDSALDMGKSFTAIGQMSKGFGVLFGMDSGAIDKSIQQLMALQNAMQGLEAIRQQMITGEGIGKYLNDIGNSFSGLTNAINNYDITFDKALTSTRASKVVLGEFAVGMKGLGSAVAGAVAELGAMWLIMEAIEQLPKWWKGASEATNWEKKLGMQLENTNKALEERSNELKKLNKNDDYAEYQKKLAEYTNETNDALEAQYKLLKSNAESFLSSKLNPGEKKQYNALYAGLTGEDFKITINNIDKVITSVKEATNEMELLRKKAIAGNEDARDSYAQLAAYVNGKWKKDMLDALQGARGNATKMKDIISQMYEEAEKNPILIDALHDIENNFLHLDGTARQAMQSMDSEVKMFANTLRGLSNNELNDLISKYDGIINANKSALEKLKEQEAQLIAEQRTLPFGAAMDKNQQALGIVQKQIADEQKRLAAQNKPRYSGGGRSKSTSTAKTEAEIEKERQALLLSIMEEGKEKELAALEEARKAKVAEAEKLGVDVNKVTEYYAKEKEKIEKKYADAEIQQNKRNLQTISNTTTQILNLKLAQAETKEEKIAAINELEQDSIYNIEAEYQELISIVEQLIANEQIGKEEGEQLIAQYNTLAGLKKKAIAKDSEEKREDAENGGAADDGGDWKKRLEKINSYVQQYGAIFQNLLSTFYDYEDSLYNAMIESIDKDIDKAREKYEALSDLAKEHADNVNSIESELANARGDRRQALIDQLNAEMAAQRAKIEEERAAQEEMKKLEAKKDQEEIKQRKKEQQRQLTQAMISGALAVANGLATPPFETKGIYMGALAAALAAVQIALIKKQKFADGGLLEGKSHAQGGIPVGNTNIEVEGGEYITNKHTTEKNLDVLTFINSKRRKLDMGDFIDFYSSGKARRNINSALPRTKFADGGNLPSLRTDISLNTRLYDSLEAYAQRPVVVSVVDINRKQADVRNVRVLAGLDG